MQRQTRAERKAQFDAAVAKAKAGILARLDRPFVLKEPKKVRPSSLAQSRPVRLKSGPQENS